MTPLFSKLNLKNQKKIHVLNCPPSFEPELAALKEVKVVRKPVEDVSFALAFAVTRAELDAASAQLLAVAVEDAVLWFAYPKGSSKKYKCEFNRDTGWSVLGEAGYEPVRQVAIDEDWSALRFRRADRIKSMRRNPARAVSQAGKQKARGGDT